MFEFCWTMPDGREHCFVIPTLVNEKPDPGPDPYFNDISILASVPRPVA